MTPSAHATISPKIPTDGRGIFVYSTRRTRLAPFNGRHVWISVITDACGHLPMQLLRLEAMLTIRFGRFDSYDPIPQPVILFSYGHDTDYVVAPFIADNKLSTSGAERGTVETSGGQ